MAKNFPNPRIDLDFRFVKLIGFPKILIPNIFCKTHYNKTVKKIKIIIKITHKKTLHIHGNPHIKLSAAFSEETLQARREWMIYSKCRKKKLPT